MAQLTFAIPAGELKLTVVVGHGRRALVDLLAKGQAPPPPVWTTALIDTGTNVTCVASAVLAKLGLISTGQASSQSVTGLAAVKLFDVSLSIPPAANAPGTMLTRHDITVMESPNALPDVDVLIGLDVLLDCKLLLDGPARHFTLEF
jgi:hypothetical protein